jgi:hypothetical protein
MAEFPFLVFVPRLEKGGGVNRRIRTSELAKRAANGA